jgi:hypothetical protein
LNVPSRLFAFFCLTIAFFATPLSQAQVETAQVSGSVTDTSGAAVPGAAIVVRNIETGFERTTHSGATGVFHLSGLPSGNYAIKVTAATLGPFAEKAVLAVGQTLTVDVHLGVQTSVTVEVDTGSSVAELNTTTNQISQTITPDQILDLPSLTRNPYDFVPLSGNVVLDPNGSTSGFGPGIGASLGGGRASGTGILLDGVENIDLYAQSVGQTIPLDAVQEYTVITSGFDVRYGRASGGIVNLITRGGTNFIHGAVYEYNRVAALESNTYYEDAQNFANKLAGIAPLPKDQFTRNQFGYALGAPILRDRLFFFSSTEWERIRSSAQVSYVIPTASYIASTAPNTQAYFAQFGKLRPNAILGAPFTPSKSAYTNSLQKVSYTAPASNAAGTPQNTWFSVNRFDYTLSPKTSMYARYGVYDAGLLNGSASSSPYAGYDLGTSNFDQAILFSVTHTFTSNLIAGGKVSYTRDDNVQPLGVNPAGPTLYSTSGGAALDLVSGLDVVLPGYLPFSPGVSAPGGGPQNFYQFLSDLEYVRGRNDIHLGGGFDQLRDNRTFGAFENSANILSTSENGALTNLAAGKLYQFESAIDPQGELPCASSLTTGATIVTPQCTLTLPLSLPSFSRENTFNDAALYGEDTYKVTPTLTVTVGLRWEYFGVQHNHNPSLDSNFFLGSGGSYPAQFRNGNLLTSPNSPVGGLYAKQLHNFAPRFGFALDLFGDAKYTLRGGYGISYERNFGNVTFNTIQNPPAYGVVSLTAKDISKSGNVPTLPISNSDFGLLAGSTGSAAFPPTSLRTVQQNIPTAYQQNYNLALAHEIARGAMIEISYAGARGIHLYSISNVNRPFFGNNYLGDTLPGTPLQPQYADINMRSADGDSYYSSMNLRGEFDRLQSVGLHLTVNYTLAHSLDDLSSTFTNGLANQSVTGFLGYLDPFHPRSSFGNSDFDTRHRIAVSAIYEPLVLERHGLLLRETLGGLTFAPIFIAQSGTAFNVWDATDTDGEAEPNIVSAPGLKFHGTSVMQPGVDKFNYIYVPPAAANTGENPANPYAQDSSDLPCYGTAGCTFTKGIDRNQFYSPGAYSFNLGTYKTFVIHDRIRAQLRAEFYNVLNHSNFYVHGEGYTDFFYINPLPAAGIPGTNDFLTTAKGSPYGAHTPSDDRRNTQLALRIEF